MANLARQPALQPSSCVTRICQLLCVMGVLAAASPGHAERLPVRVFTALDGLGSNLVGCVRRGSRGFMWFCTSDGLTRFDGSNFITYGVESGLPHPMVNDLLEHPAGIYWLATNGGGVARFDAAAREGTQAGTNRPRMIVYPVGPDTQTNRVNVLHRDGRGRIWAGTDFGLFRMDEPTDDAAFRRFDVGGLGTDGISDLVEDRHGQLWIAAGTGLFGILSNGEGVEYAQRVPGVNPDVRSLLPDRAGRLWIGSAAGLTVFTPGTRGCQKSPQVFSMDEARRCRPSFFPGEAVHAIEQHSDGRVWIAGATRLQEFDGQRFATYTEAQGLTGGHAIGEDGAGNLWLGTDDGLLRIARNGLVSYNKADGLDPSSASSFFETNRGELCLVLDQATRLACFRERRFEVFRVNAPESEGFWGWAQTAFQDDLGEWWIPTGNGLYRFPGGDVQTLHRSRPRAVYTKKDGLTGDNIFRLYEDAVGDIWIGTISSERNRLTRWERATGRLHRYTERDGLRRFSAPTAFAEDRAGNLWIGFYEGGVARYRDGHFTFFTADAGVPAGMVRLLLLDHKGRLWIATGSGQMARADQPEAPSPRFAPFAHVDRSGSRAIYSLVEDKWGRLYIGTARGLARLDPATGQTRRYTPADGLADVAVHLAFRDQDGALWFGTRRGVSRLVPEELEPDEPERVFIGRVNIDGDLLPLSQLGESRVSLPALSSRTNQLRIEYFGLAFGVGRTLRYQYRLEGADENWSPPSEEQAVTYARLAPGDYRFTVRLASGSDGASPPSASAIFRVLPPMWQRWWFLTLSATVGLALAVGVHRYRVSRLVELERVRVRIATDLHDDIGSNLSKIALLSGVTAQQVAQKSPEVAQRLSSIADISQESVDSMSDIVWAIDPAKDRLHDLVLRMRRFASDVFTARDIALHFTAPVADEDLALGADVRREVFLIFKEAVNNIGRHAACTTAEIELRVEARGLALMIRDDGNGFRPEQNGRAGNGLASMERRARTLGGGLDLTSSPLNGTCITLTIPLRQNRRWVTSPESRVDERLDMPSRTKTAATALQHRLLR
ncbi:MAG: hypothetical protein GEU99_20010 [Luteitalea sp.]|nr:hypothetical protein [Luteitalea sp.]